MEVNFDTLVLSNGEMKLLRDLLKRDDEGLKLEDNNKHVGRLIENDLAMWVVGDIYCITPNGTSYCLYAKSIKANRRKESVRYWITTAIAIAAFILSAIALLLELGVIQKA